MTPQEQAQVGLAASARAIIRRGAVAAGDAAAIRAAVELVLPEDAGLCVYELTPREYGRLCVREEFLAIAAALEAPSND